MAPSERVPTPEEAAFLAEVERAGLGFWAFSPTEFYVAWHSGLDSEPPSQRRNCIVCGSNIAEHSVVGADGEIRREGELGNYRCDVCEFECVQLFPDGTLELPWPELQAMARQSHAAQRTALKHLEEAARRSGHGGIDPLFLALTDAGEAYSRSRTGRGFV